MNQTKKKNKKKNRLKSQPNMIIPIRCFTCNKILGSYSHIEEFSLSLFDELDIKRYCCRKILLHSKDIHKDDKQTKFIDGKAFQIKNQLEITRVVIPR